MGKCQSMSTSNNFRRNKIINMPYITEDSLKIIISQKEKSICKIFKDNQVIGTGFLCIIPYKSNYLPVLFTCNHILNNHDIKIGKEIKLLFNDKITKIIKIDENRRTHNSDEEEYDSAIIEIKKEDGFDIDNMLEIDNAIFENKKLVNENVYILHYPKGLISAFTLNIIKNIDFSYNIIEHLCGTEEGSSGAPILCLNNNKVIGYHIGSQNNIINTNLGRVIRGPIDAFNKKLFKSNIFSENEIKYNYNYCYSQEEKEKINLLLKEKKYKNNEIIFYKGIIQINKDFSYYKEILTIQTDKKEGEEYNSYYEFITATINEKVISYTVKKNNDDLYDFEETTTYPRRFSVKISYNLSSSDNSIVSFEINSKVETRIVCTLTRIHMTSLIFNMPFALKIFFSEDFNFLLGRYI